MREAIFRPTGIRGSWLEQISLRLERLGFGVAAAGNLRVVAALA